MDLYSRKIYAPSNFSKQTQARSRLRGDLREARFWPINRLDIHNAFLVTYSPGGGGRRLLATGCPRLFFRVAEESTHNEVCGCIKNAHAKCDDRREGFCRRATHRASNTDSVES